MLKRLVFALACSALLLAAAPPARADTCAEYGGLNSLPYHQLGLYESYYAVDIQTRGNHIYMFDGGHLDCLSLENPYQITPTNYTPAINITPNPSRLLKIGDDWLYAWHGGGVAVIDISQTVPPVLVTTVPTFGSGTYVGEWDGYGFFVTSSFTVEVYDFANPLAPQLAATLALPLGDGYLSGGAVGAGHVYTMWSTSNFQEMVICDVTTPTSPTVAAHHAAGGYYPEQFFPIMENSSGYAMYVAENRLSVSYNTLQLAPQSTNSITYLLDDPLDPTVVGGTDGTSLALANGLEYGYDAGPHGGYNWDVWLNFAGSSFYGWYGYPQYPSGIPANLVLTDRAVVFTTNLYGTDYIVAAPRQCDAPTIVAGSVAQAIVYQPSGAIDVTVTWRTEGWTDPLFDRVVFSDGPRNPPAGQFGTITHSGGADPVQQPDGTWLHTMTHTIPQCVPKCTYYFDVRSVRTGLAADVTGKYVKITYCFQQVDEPVAATDQEITASPNPFNPQTELSFTVPQDAGAVSLAIYGLDGRKVRDLDVGAGTGEVRAVWSGRDNAGRKVPSGIYFARLVTAKRTVNKKLMLLK